MARNLTPGGGGGPGISTAPEDATEPPQLRSHCGRLALGACGQGPGCSRSSAYAGAAARDPQDASDAGFCSPANTTLRRNAGGTRIRGSCSSPTIRKCCADVAHADCKQVRASTLRLLLGRGRQDVAATAKGSGGTCPSAVLGHGRRSSHSIQQGFNEVHGWQGWVGDPPRGDWGQCPCSHSCCRWLFPCGRERHLVTAKLG
mmetsp:Transcript_63508/g.129397  ORF Transcript_63508/g.129397 Transcript_63508/m.129397 type:complete len:202 (+) Transcript_63508:870-1475(+)